MPVLELRQYTLVPGGRDTLIELFEAELVAPQERLGMEIVGTFRDLDDENTFVWVRRFPDMVRRAASLRAFYGGPVWRRHRDAANATMVDSDNVLLLRPAWPRSDFGLTPRATRTSSAANRGVLQLGIASFRRPVDDAVLDYFSDQIEPQIERAGATLLACLTSEPAANTFPALPVREGENVLVWFAGLPNAGSSVAAPSSLSLEGAASSWPGLDGAPEIRLLAPTDRSRLTGSCDAEIASRTAAHRST